MMQKLPKPESTAAFKEQAIKRASRTVGAVAKEMGLVEQTLHHGVKAFDADTLHGQDTLKVTLEAMDLSRLRTAHARGCDPKKATASFGRDA